jgi:hypothetical protein
MVPFSRSSCLFSGLQLGLLVLTSLPHLVPGAGVTIVTHGFNGDAQGWVLGMAENIPGYYRFPGTNVICYEVSVMDSGGFVVSSRKLAGGNPTNEFTAEIVIKLDWGDLAGFFSQYDTYEVAAALVPRLLQTNFIAELRGHALAELPIHLVGHSRGGSLVCQISRLLGTNGVWVDHVTTLDPHPVNEDGNTDPLLVSDAPLRIYENVLFADNYYQEFGGYPHGQFMESSYNRRLAALPGGYSSAHSDMHLWYHATIDLLNPADDTEALLQGNDRATWFLPYEDGGARAGFHYGRLGGGNRVSLEQPAGPGTDYPAYGYNQRWNLGAGVSPNRTSLPSNHGNWPNLITVHLTGTNSMAQGETNELTFVYQWARPATSNALVSVHLDDDFNPFNGNERLVGQLAASGTASNNVGVASVSLNVAATNSTPGVHSVYARIAAGGRTRYLYAPELLTVFSNVQPPSLAIARLSGSGILVEVSGVPGQRIVLESGADLRNWQPLATNVLTTASWTYLDNSGSQATAQRFFRAALR